jgi:ribose-phosphate pyrophosphokinase
VYIISLPGDPGIGRSLAEKLDAEYSEAFSKIFPDGETYIRLDKRPASEDEVFLIQSMYPDQDRRFFELLEALDILRQHKNINILLTYMAYARQDKIFLEGEPISARIVIESLLKDNVRNIFVVEPHSNMILSYNKIRVIDGVSIFSDIIKREIETEKIIIISPDQGGVERARRLATKLGVDMISFIKYRDRHTGEIRIEMPADLHKISGMNTVIVDDILSTGGTIAESAEILRRYKAEKVIVVCTHCLFVSNALDKVRSSGVDKIYCANTVKKKINDPLIYYLDISRYIKDVLSREL